MNQSEQIEALKRQLEQERAAHLEAMRSLAYKSMHHGVTASGHVPIQLREAWRDAFVSVKKSPEPVRGGDVVAAFTLAFGLLLIVLCVLGVAGLI